MPFMIRPYRRFSVQCLQRYITRFINKERASVLLLVIFGLSYPQYLFAIYTSSCAPSAGLLQSAADSYENAKSDYESACNQYYGYSRNELGACGPYGYVRSELEEAKGRLSSAINDVESMCGVPDEKLNSMLAALFKIAKENEELQKRVFQLERDAAIPRGI